MAFTTLKLTTFGSNIEAKSHQGKGLHFTRVAIGDGLLGGGSMINRERMVSERHSMGIEGIVATENSSQSAVIVTLDNSEIQEGFFYRELALFAKDPDTGQEGVYLYDNAGQECEFLDTRDNGVVIYERLKLLIRVEQADAVTFDASGNPLYLAAEDVEDMIGRHNRDEDAHPRKADLGADGKLLAEQMPEMDYESPLSGAAGKDTPVDGDSVVVTDSEDGGKTKRLLWSRVKAVLKAYFDGLYAALSHTHTKSQITDFPSSMPASDVSAWAKASSKPSYTASEVGAAAASHTHTKSQITDFPSSLPANGGNAATVGGQTPEQLIAAAVAQGARIATGSYLGTGTYGSSNPCSLTFDFTPSLVFLYMQDYYPAEGSSVYFSRAFVVMLKDGKNARIRYSSTVGNLLFTMENNGCTYYSGDSGTQYNISNINYYYLALG